MKDRHASGVHALDQSKRGIANDLLLERWGDFLNGAQLGKFFNLENPRVLSGVVKDMESADGIEAQQIRTYLFGYYAAISNSETVEPRRKGKGRNKGKGKGSLPGGKAGVISQHRLSNLHLSDCVPAQKMNCEKCNHRMIDGLSKCENCYISMEAWSDNRIATEVCRLESRAAEKSGVFSIDQISTVQPRKHRMGSEARQNDPFFMFNCSIAQLTRPCCNFLHRLGASISPDEGRSFQARDQGKGTGIKSRVLFMPIIGRDPAAPLDISKESMVCHSGRFFTPAQFAVYDKGGSSTWGTRADGLWLVRTDLDARWHRGQGELR